MRVRRFTVITSVVVAAALVPTSWAAASQRSGAEAKTHLTKVSSDPYDQPPAQHATEAEPDTFAYGDTVVSVFQVGRYSDGGSVNTGWATSTDGGATWTHGFLPDITVAEGGPWQRVSDPAVAYDPKHGVWLVSGLVINSGAEGVVISRSKDGIHWKKPVPAAGLNGQGYDKEWVACDTWPDSKYYGNCYVEADVTSLGNRIIMTTSKDGGKTWGDEKATADSAIGLGGQPVVQPDGTVVVPYSANFSAQRAFRSTNGGKSWSASVLIDTVSDHSVPGMREEPLPSAEVDASGKVYVVWDDCRFRTGCTANDIVMSTSRDGVTWSKVTRIPIDGVKSGADHFTPGLGVSPDLSGSHALLGLYYYFYPVAACQISDCRLQVGYISSDDGGKTWGKDKTLTGRMHLDWLAQAGGAMVGDYLSCSIIGKKAVSVFAVGKAPKASKKNQAMYTAGGLPIG